jgi:hypothetical protein
VLVLVLVAVIDETIASEAGETDVLGGTIGGDDSNSPWQNFLPDRVGVLTFDPDPEIDLNPVTISASVSLAEGVVVRLPPVALETED